MVRDGRIEIPASSSRGLSLALSGFMSLSVFAYASPLSGTGHSGNSPPSSLTFCRRTKGPEMN